MATQVESCVRCAQTDPSGRYFFDTKLCPTCDHSFYDWWSRALGNGSYSTAVSTDMMSLVAHWKDKVAPYAKAP